MGKGRRRGGRSGG
ncbi:unnamed protein product [Spirodela intermedia]|nr:unnamed protein product [Spirodela intermedia]